MAPIMGTSIGHDDGCHEKHIKQLCPPHHCANPLQQATQNTQSYFTGSVNTHTMGLGADDPHFRYISLLAFTTCNYSGIMDTGYCTASKKTGLSRGDFSSQEAQWCEWND